MSQIYEQVTLLLFILAIAIITYAGLSFVGAQVTHIQNTQTQNAREYIQNVSYEQQNMSITDKTALISQACDIYVGGSDRAQECKQELIKEFITYGR